MSGECACDGDEHRTALSTRSASAGVACLLRSLRVVMVQTVGMAVIAALIGAGGFGALVFQGLLSSAVDLVLLGVIPVIALAVLIDALFDLGIALLKVTHHD